MTCQVCLKQECHTEASVLTGRAQYKQEDRDWGDMSIYQGIT